MTSRLTDLAVMATVALVFLTLFWSKMRLDNSGAALKPRQKKLLGYSFLFISGTLLLMFLVADFHGPKKLLFPMIGAWGLVVALAAWSRRGRSNSDNAVR
jgi:hypothetical protein